MTFTLCVAFYNAGSQHVIVNESQLKGDPGLFYLPDVEGNVLLHEDFFNLWKKSSGGDTVLVFPGWPQTRSGTSRRGGIHCNLDQDEDLEVLYNIGSKTWAWKLDGTDVPGWPFELQGYSDGTPAFGDITGDGEGEIIITTRHNFTANEGRLYAISKSGDLLPGFPVTLTGGAVNSPVLADINGNGRLEIIVEERYWPKGFVSVYRGDGSVMNGWPVDLDYIPASAAAAGDITGDGVPEIIAESLYSIYAFDTSGNTLPHFPFTPGETRAFSYSAPVLADMDGDSIREILVGDHSTEYGYGQVYIIDNTAKVLDGWPRTTANWIFNSVSVADIDYDGHPDVITGDQVLHFVPWNHIYAWDRFGNFLEGFPTAYIWAVNNQVMIVDIDNDKYPELICDDNTAEGKYLAFNHDGTPVTGWPVPLMGSSFYMNPFFTDMNMDGKLDFCGGGIENTVPQCHIYVWNTENAFQPSRNVLPVLQYNLRHDGVYRLPDHYIFANFEPDTHMVQPGDEIAFSDLSLGNILEREWYFQGGTPTFSGEQNPTVTYNFPGEFDVSLTVTDGTVYDTLLLPDLIHVTVPAMTGPAGDADNAIEIFPDPDGGSVCVRFLQKNRGNVHIDISDLSGRRIFRTGISIVSPRTWHRMEIPAYISGIFLIRITTEEGMVTKKIFLH